MTNGTKDWAQYGSALGMLASAVILTFISFFVKGDVTHNTLYYVAQCILYAGGVFGITTYVRREVSKMMDSLNKGGKDDSKS